MPELSDLLLVSANPPSADVDPTEGAEEALVLRLLVGCDARHSPEHSWTVGAGTRRQAAVSAQQLVVQSVLLQPLHGGGVQALEILRDERVAALLGRADQRPAGGRHGHGEAAPAVEVAAVLQPHLLASLGRGQAHRARGLRGLEQGPVHPPRQVTNGGLHLHKMDCMNRNTDYYS